MEPTSYDKHWLAKGAYGLERVRRKNIRKEARAEKARMSKMCKCGRNEKDDRAHTCPYQEDMYNAGGTSSCYCCGSCTHTCAMDI